MSLKTFLTRSTIYSIVVFEIKFFLVFRFKLDIYVFRGYDCDYEMCADVDCNRMLHKNSKRQPF